VLRADENRVHVAAVPQLVPDVVKQFGIGVDAFPMKAKFTRDLVGGLAGQNAGLHDVSGHRLCVGPQLVGENQLWAPLEESIERLFPVVFKQDLVKPKRAADPTSLGPRRHGPAVLCAKSGAFPPPRGCAEGIIGSECNPAFFDGSKNLFRVILMIRFLHVQFGVRYNPRRMDRSERNYDPKDVDDHFICGILSEKRMGTCATLPVFAVALGRRLGYPLKLVKVPDHLLFRWEDENERFNIEYNGETGNVYPDEHYHEWPVRWTAAIQAPQPFARWLISNSREEEVAGFLGLRALVLDAYHRTGEALQCIDAAQRFNPIAAPLYDEARATFIAGFVKRMSPDPRGLPNALTPYLIESLLPTMPFHPSLNDWRSR